MTQQSHYGAYTLRMTSITCGGEWSKLTITADGILEPGRWVGFPPTWTPLSTAGTQRDPARLAQGASLI